MALDSDSEKDNFNAVIHSFKNENLEVKQVFKSGFFNGVGVVKNNKLAGRLEDVKFLESYEPNLRLNFINEGKMLSSIDHDSIPKLYDIIEQDNTLLFRTEHIEGYSLKEVLDVLKQSNQKFPKNIATQIMLKLANALNYAHNNVIYDGKKVKIIHCDIKPSNIILTAKNYKRKSKVSKQFLKLLLNNKVEPKIIDFGIAKFKGSSKEGTLPYLSKSQINNKPLNWKTDTYQLALIYYEMLTLNNPFNALKRDELSKLKQEKFKIKENLNANIQKFIEKGMDENFENEKDSINLLKKINSKEKIIGYVEKNKKPLIAVAIVFLLFSLSLLSLNLYDKYILSSDAMIKKIENNPNISLKELESAIKKIQKRSFEKKYLNPLLNGEFTDKITDEPIYPSSLDADGNWILTGPSEESAGAFAGLLFKYSTKYPQILDLATKYTKPIFESEFDGTSPLRFYYSLIPAYEITNDNKYLNKLINISNSHVSFFKQKKGMMQSMDIYSIELFIWLYKKTGEEKYLNLSKYYLDLFISNNIDDDGYVYFYSMVNATTPYGPLPDTKMTSLVTKLDANEIGFYIPISNLSQTYFKEITSIFSRDFIEIFSVLDDMYVITNDLSYQKKSEKLISYYLDRLSNDGLDYLFTSYLNEDNNIPHDALATLKSIKYFKEKNSTIYNIKLRNIISYNYFNQESDKGILSGNVLINRVVYNHKDEKNKNQTLILSDKYFLELLI